MHGPEKYPGFGTSQRTADGENAVNQEKAEWTFEGDLKEMFFEYESRSKALRKQKPAYRMYAMSGRSLNNASSRVAPQDFSCPSN